MAWFDDPREYYKAFEERDPTGQGDIVIAPTTVILPGAAESDIVGPADIGQSRRSTIWHAASEELPAAPAISTETQWSLAMVVPHACAMEKEWNERRIELGRQGMSDDDATVQANSEDDLDQFVTLAPLRLYPEVPEWKHRGIRVGQRLGFFPVCEDGEIPESFIDLNRPSTVHYTLVKRVLRQRSLSDLALAHLQHALAMHFAYRGLTGLEELEEAVGHTIVKLMPTNRAKGRLVVNIILDNGQTLTFEGHDAPRPPEVARPARV